jgi:hypothetical protein
MGEHMKHVYNSYVTWLSALALLVVCGCSNGSNSGKSSNMSTGGASGARKASAGSGATAGSGGHGSVATGSAQIDGLTVTGPITGGKETIFTASSADLVGRGYTEKEFFFEGDATAYTAPGGMTMDGKWKLTETTKAPFKSRLLVRRPKDASKFNGTVVVEWLNVSGGADGDPGFMYNADLILREGYAYVGVSAQAVGVEGGGLSLGAGPGAVPLKQFDPERYGSLKHPGDDYSFDIYSQAARAIRSGHVLEGLVPERLIAYGESQSAIRMVSYVDGVHPLAKIYDGFFIHSRGASGVPFDSAGGGGGLSLGGFGGGSAVFVRDDIDEKVFQFETETDVTGMLAFLPARQPDSDKLRTWEVAGTAHADQYIVDFNASMVTAGAVQCDGANTGPQYRVIRAALHSLHLWMRDGTVPARGEVLQADSSGKSLRDVHGNALGGVRSPDVDVPTKTLSGDPPANNTGSFWCFLFGSTTPFTADVLKSLYSSHEDYVMKVKASASEVRAGGFLLEAEEQGFVTDAEGAHVPD